MNLPRIVFRAGARIEKGSHRHIGMALDEIAAYERMIHAATHENCENFHQKRQLRERFERGRGR
jgi:hypothetical protein